MSDYPKPVVGTYDYQAKTIVPSSILENLKTTGSAMGDKTRKSRPVNIKVEKLYGWSTPPYWWIVHSSNPYEYKSGATLTERGAIRKAKRVARKMLKQKKPDKIVYQEEIV